MHAIKIDTTIPEDHRLIIELPQDLPPGEAQVLVFSGSKPPQGTGRDILAFLRENPLPEGSCRSPEEMEADIKSERDAWE